jgi:choline dehydrogenase
VSDPQAFDYIVIGAGSSGAVIASRLSEDPSVSVLLLEAGPRHHPLTFVPASFALLIDEPGANWRYGSVPEEATAHRVLAVPRGKVLGGSSAINGLLYVRGNAADYDEWEALGNPGWGWSGVEPLFRALECYPEGDARLRGHNGPVRITRARERNPLFHAMFAAARERGIRVNEDYNAGEQEGLAMTQATLADGRRMSADRCYLSPASGRRNLTVSTGSHVTGLALQERVCTGVHYIQGGVQRQAAARREVILCAGAIGSPQLLELSGIGDPAVLQAAGVPVRHALPGVGENLRDHLMVRGRWRLLDDRVSYNNRVSGWRGLLELLKYATARRGYLSQSAAPLIAFLRSRGDLPAPDIQLTIAPLLVRDIKKRKLERFPGMTVGCYQLKPQSTGSVHLRTGDAQAAPQIRFNFLSSETDRRALIDGLGVARQLIGAAPMDGLRGEELSPGVHVDTPEAILDYIRRTGETAYHPVGTCKMGRDPMAVVDAELRVHGLRGLRVADGSIMPTMPSGNTNAACLMIGEKAARMIRTGGP